MDITHNKTGDLSGDIKIIIKKEDYEEKVNSAIKDLQKQAQMPGFRQGKVPVNLIKKLHGKNVLKEQVNEVLGESLINYIKEQELNILGNPLPYHEKNETIDWDNQTEFEFNFYFGLLPDIEFKLSDEIVVDYYKIKVENKLIEEQIENLRRQFGKIISPEESAEEDFIFGELIQMSNESTEAENPLTNKHNIVIKEIEDNDTKSNFISKKIGDEIIFDLNKAFTSKSHKAKVLNIEEEKVPETDSLFKLKVENISRVEPAELNEELYSKVAPDKNIKNKTELKEKIKDEISQQYQAEVDKHFKNDVRETLVEKADIKLPEDFVKEWLHETNKEELSKEKVEENIDYYLKSLKWQLLENEIIKDHKVDVSEEEIKSHIRKYFTIQMKQYGHQVNENDDMLESLVNNFMQKQEDVNKVKNQIVEDKLTDIFKKSLKLKEKDITFDKFKDIITEKYNIENKK